MVVKFLLSSFTNAITQCINPNFESSDSSQISILHPLVSFTLNKSTLTCIGVQEWFKKFVMRAKMSTPSLNIQRSKLMEIIVTNVRFGNTCKFVCFFFFPLQEAHHPQAQSKKEIMKLKDIGVKLTFLAIYFL